MREYNKKVMEHLDEEALLKAGGFTYSYAMCFVLYQSLEDISAREGLFKALKEYQERILDFTRGSSFPENEFVACLVEDTFSELEEDFAEAEIWKAICKARGGE